MNIKQFREKTVGTNVKLLPRPQYEGSPIKKEFNIWLVIEEEGDKVFLFQNTHTRHEARLGADNFQEFRSPNIVILRGQLIMKAGKETDFEPNSPGLVEDNLEGLTEGKQGIQSNSIFESLKPHEGQLVTIKFPEKDGTKYYPQEVLLEKCNTHFLTFCRPEKTFLLPDWMHGPSSVPPHESMKIPEKKCSVPIEYVSLAEDPDNDRPLIIFDQTFWEDER